MRPCVRFWYWSVSLNVLDNWKSWIIIWDYGYKCTKNYQMVILIFWLMKRLYRSFTKFWVKFDIKVALNFRLLFIIWYRKHFRVNFTKLLCNCQLVISHQGNKHIHTKLWQWYFFREAIPKLWTKRHGNSRIKDTIWRYSELTKHLTQIFG